MSRPVRLTVVGDALLDRDVDGVVERLCPDAPVPVVDRRAETVRAGGAALAATLAVADGCAVTLVTALGDDERGAELARLLARDGVTLVDLGLAAPTPEKLRVRAAGRTLLRIDSGERRPAAVGTATGAAAAAVGAADALLVADYGRGVAAKAGVRSALAAAAEQRPLVWDPHPLGPPPLPGAALVTPNAAEAAGFSAAAAGAGEIEAAAARGAALRDRWRCGAVAVTLGARGALLIAGEPQPRLLPAPPAAGGDACGAGDRFAARAATALAAGDDVPHAVAAAVDAASGFVDGGGAAAWRTPARAVRAAVAAGAARPHVAAGGAVELAARARAAGRRVVATGGCFDLLHAGHVRMLAAARELGDLLVVCLNSDSSVAALKGPGRPLVPQAARAAVLAALDSVDAVLIFDDPTPVAAIERLRPAIWVKGGDYGGEELPEAGAVRAAGGDVVVLPRLDGHSTTRLIEEAIQRNAA